MLLLPALLLYIVRWLTGSSLKHVEQALTWIEKLPGSIQYLIFGLLVVHVIAIFGAVVYYYRYVGSTKPFKGKLK
jgi:hypothetical protein